MTRRPIRFYQVGSFAVGNRLLSDDERTEQSNPNRSNSIDAGHRACQGCGEALGARYALDAAMREALHRLAVAGERAPVTLRRAPQAAASEAIRLRKPPPA